MQPVILKEAYQISVHHEDENIGLKILYTLLLKTYLQCLLSYIHDFLALISSP